LTVTPQLSPDGLFWCDAESESLAITETGTYTLSVESNFGHWLALQGELHSAPQVDAQVQRNSPQVKLIIYLALKE
jgi:hypothetical protein